MACSPIVVSLSPLPWTRSLLLFSPPTLLPTHQHLSVIRETPVGIIGVFSPILGHVLTPPHPLLSDDMHAMPPDDGQV